MQTKETEKNFKKKLTFSKKERIKIIALLTSRIESKNKIPAYGFFKIEKKEYPVIFRIKNEIDKWTKPKIPKSTVVNLDGYFSYSGKSRPSFTCFSYTIPKKIGNE